MPTPLGSWTGSVRATVVRAFAVKPDGSTVGGHLWELHVNPTLEVFVTAEAAGLEKRADEGSGMKLIDPGR
ncbi:MAG TPA: hypothetical protein VHQ47_09130 [Phycisphaerae bacterium]|nr:hypothetical protein [Phycisphaerae bacterium]